jgi:hypothetical protein
VRDYELDPPPARLPWTGEPASTRRTHERKRDRGRVWARPRNVVVDALRHHWSLVEVTIPILLVLGLGAIGMVPDRAAIVAATIVALMELAATGAYGARRQGAGALGIIASGAIAFALGLVIAVLKFHVH